MFYTGAIASHGRWYGIVHIIGEHHLLHFNCASVYDQNDLLRPVVIELEPSLYVGVVIPQHLYHPIILFY